MDEQKPAEVEEVKKVEFRYVRIDRVKKRLKEVKKRCSTDFLQHLDGLVSAEIGRAIRQSGQFTTIHAGDCTRVGETFKR